ncbi:Mitochondrial phenylalanine--tRNA ligase [Lachnellula suecica]|uniref:Phenylalanine--tRNA ligase, mitochondrial n=1 Tax=Lachnellula suecica TaxID=602035 RepID=A0A8T9BX37_9HELO|nr:Mitochondrial phenylalanine--tRNA ligase [Lachnellula suecica]
MRSLAQGQRFSAGKEALALFTGLANVSSRRLRVCTQCRYSSASTSTPKTQTLNFNGKSYQTDDWYNVPPAIESSIARLLHTQKDHPISITRSIIESRFPGPTYKYYNSFHPVVSTHQNFDSLGFPLDHPGRSKTDTYYINKDTVLRTHTSAHQADVFNANQSPGFLISADVYRRDAIDRTHNPVFHQMEGARMWDRNVVPNGDIAAAVWKDIESLPKHDMIVEDPNPATHAERNPLQDGAHSLAEAQAVAAHLKRSLELVVVEIFSRAKKASPDVSDEPLKVRWVEAYFPFTSPSWELEIFWQGDWLEVLGCGVVKQDIMQKAGVPSQVGWAFGVGLERIAMLLFEIPDIRLFWSQDERFLGQFKGLSENMDKLKRFVPFSKYPACYKDVAFWLRSSSSSAGGGLGAAFHENDVMEIVRGVGGNVVEDVTQVDEFTHPKTGRKSFCYRINYRSLERTLTNEEANEYHEKVRQELVDKLGVELR